MIDGSQDRVTELIREFPNFEWATSDQTAFANIVTPVGRWISYQVFRPLGDQYDLAASHLRQLHRIVKAARTHPAVNLMVFQGRVKLKKRDARYVELIGRALCLA